MNPDVYSGVERRRADAHVVAQMHELLTRHRNEEMERYAEILSKIDNNRAEADWRHETLREQLHQLTMSINAFMDTTQDFHRTVEKAFPRDQEGSPDFDGHRESHKAMIDDSKAKKELMAYVKKVVLASIITAIVIGYLGSSKLFSGVAEGAKQAEVVKGKG